MQQELQNKKGLVNNVFDKSYDKYDLMNDIMSLGIHRIWKKDLIFWMSPKQNKNLIDVASGTGDIAKLFSKLTNNKSKVLCIDPNKKMISKYWYVNTQSLLKGGKKQMRHFLQT